jgi:hypothetical protein
MTTDAGVSFVLKFDCSHVADCHSSAMQESAEESEVVEDEYDAEDYQDDHPDSGSMPFHLEAEVRRSNIGNKFLTLDLEVSSDLEDKEKYSLFLCRR